MDICEDTGSWLDCGISADREDCPDPDRSPESLPALPERDADVPAPDPDQDSRDIPGSRVTDAAQEDRNSVMTSRRTFTFCMEQTPYTFRILTSSSVSVRDLPIL